MEWHRAGEPGNTWDLMISVIETDPPWGPVARALNGDDWVWYIPGYNNLQTLVETSVLAMYQRANKKPTNFKRAVRPWEKKERKLKAAVMPAAEFEDFFKSRFQPTEIE